ncbi:MAG: hypothetical protein J2P48_13090 [Alphaproteobacteria bacterium]|jgi:hypothetical protein|nr:hypothetical protein [Alphaproteobacteria bacterium]
MISIRFGLLALALTAAVGCDVIGAPERASDTQNLNGVSDDIAALSMTRSGAMHASDPMASTVLPFHDQLPRD